MARPQGPPIAVNSYGIHQEGEGHFKHGAEMVQNAGRMPLQQLPQAVDGIYGGI